MTDEANTVANTTNTTPAPVAQTAPVAAAQTAPVVVANTVSGAQTAPAVLTPVAVHEERVKSETSFLKSVGQKLGERHEEIQSANAAAPVVAVANNAAASTKVLTVKGNEERAFLTGILKDIQARLVSL